MLINSDLIVVDATELIQDVEEEGPIIMKNESVKIDIYVV